MNTVIAGDYINGVILDEFDKLVIGVTNDFAVINAKTVKAYELVNEESNKSAASGVARGIVGGALLGGVGAIAGAASAKEKGTYQVAVEFVDGKKSLLKLDNKAYQTLTKVCFGCGSGTIEEANEINENYKNKKKKGNKAGVIVIGIVFLLFIIICSVLGITQG